MTVMISTLDDESNLFIYIPSGFFFLYTIRLVLRGQKTST
jgi:hypothetical protein